MIKHSGSELNSLLQTEEPQHIRRLSKLSEEKQNNQHVVRWRWWWNLRKSNDADEGRKSRKNRQPAGQNDDDDDDDEELRQEQGVEEQRCSRRKMIEWEKRRYEKRRSSSSGRLEVATSAAGISSTTSSSAAAEAAISSTTEPLLKKSVDDADEDDEEAEEKVQSQKQSIDRQRVRRPTTLSIAATVVGNDQFGGNDRIKPRLNRRRRQLSSSGNNNNSSRWWLSRSLLLLLGGGGGDRRYYEDDRGSIERCCCHYEDRARDNNITTNVGDRRRRQIIRDCSRCSDTGDASEQPANNGIAAPKEDDKNFANVADSSCCYSSSDHHCNRISSSRTNVAVLPSRSIINVRRPSSVDDKSCVNNTDQKNNNPNENINNNSIDYVNNKINHRSIVDRNNCCAYYSRHININTNNNNNNNIINNNNNNNNNSIVLLESSRERIQQSSNNWSIIRTDMILQRNYIPPKYNIYIATCAANLSALAAGCALTWSSPTLPKLSEPGEKLHITKEQGAWLSSLIALGAAFGPFVACSAVDTIGRKWTLLIDMIIFLLSWITIALTEDIGVMYFARFLSGIAVGCIFTVLPMYIAEVSPVKMRGTLGSLLQFFLCLGFCVSYCVGPFTSFSTLTFVSACMPLLCVLFFAWIPESPYYLINKGRKQEAYNALEWFRGYPDKSVVQSEIADIQVSAEESSKKKGSLMSLFGSRKSLKALYYACALVMFQQMSGVNIVLFYSETIFKATGSALSPSISTIIIGLVMISTAAIAAPAAKIVGVKNLLIISAIGEGVSTGTLGMYFFLLVNGEDVSLLGWLPITSLVLFIVTYSVGFGPFVWVIMAEIFPSHLKAIASAVTASFCWLLCFVLTKFFTTFTEAVGIPYAFWLFSVFCVLALLFTVTQLPDTQGKSFAEIQEMLHGKKKVETEKA